MTPKAETTARATRGHRRRYPPQDRSDLTAAVKGSPAIDIWWVGAGIHASHTESLAPWDVAAAGLVAVATRRRMIASRQQLVAVATPGEADARQRRRLRLAALNAQEAELLRTPRNRPLLVTENINVDHTGAVVEFGVARYPTPRVQIVFEL